MERKDFLKNTLALLGITTLAVNCSKTEATPTTGTTSSDSCAITDSETAGPYPTNSPSALVRTNIADGQSGVPLTITITVKNANNSCALLSGAMVDIWHCTAAGYYSEYVDGPGAGNASVDYRSAHFLRGRQSTDAKGQVSFTSIFPGWYSGRAPHIHVHIYDSTGKSLLVTQIAFPTDVCNTIYTTAADYRAHGKQDTANSSDMVFRDSLDNELATVTGSVAAGYALTHNITVGA